MRIKASIFLFVAIAFLIPVTVLAILKWSDGKWGTLPVYEGRSGMLTDFHLRNQYNQPVSLKNWEGKIVVVDFFFTHCPSICPKMTSGLKKVQASFPAEPNLLFNSFSVDPTRDSVARLKDYADQFGINHNWNLLTGSKEAIYNLARNSFLVAPGVSHGTENDFMHTDKLVLIDKQQKIRGYYQGTSNKDIQTLIHDIQKLQDEK
jgi:protein SCO1/2